MEILPTLMIGDYMKTLLFIVIQLLLSTIQYLSIYRFFPSLAKHISLHELNEIDYPQSSEFNIKMGYIFMIFCFIATCFLFILSSINEHSFFTIVFRMLSMFICAELYDDFILDDLLINVIYKRVYRRYMNKEATKRCHHQRNGQELIRVLLGIPAIAFLALLLSLI